MIQGDREGRGKSAGRLSLPVPALTWGCDLAKRPASVETYCALCCEMDGTAGIAAMNNNNFYHGCFEVLSRSNVSAM